MRFGPDGVFGEVQLRRNAGVLHGLDAEALTVVQLHRGRAAHLHARQRPQRHLAQLAVDDGVWQSRMVGGVKALQSATNGGFGDEQAIVVRQKQPALNRFAHQPHEGLVGDSAVINSKTAAHVAMRATKPKLFDTDRRALLRHVRKWRVRAVVRVAVYRIVVGVQTRLKLGAVLVQRERMADVDEAFVLDGGFGGDLGVKRPQTDGGDGVPHADELDFHIARQRRGKQVRRLPGNRLDLVQMVLAV